MNINELKPEEKYGYVVFEGRDGDSREPKQPIDEYRAPSVDFWQQVAPGEESLKNGFHPAFYYRRRIDLGNKAGAEPEWRMVAWEEQFQSGDEFWNGLEWVPLFMPFSWTPRKAVIEECRLVVAVRRRIADAPVPPIAAETFNRFLDELVKNKVISAVLAHSEKVTGLAITPWSLAKWVAAHAAGQHEPVTSPVIPVKPFNALIECLAGLGVVELHPVKRAADASPETAASLMLNTLKRETDPISDNAVSLCYDSKVRDALHQHGIPHDNLAQEFTPMELAVWAQKLVSDAKMAGKKIGLAEAGAKQPEAGTCGLCGVALNRSDVREYGPQKLQLHERCVTDLILEVNPEAWHCGQWTDFHTECRPANNNHRYYVQFRNGLIAQLFGHEFHQQLTAQIILRWLRPFPSPKPPVILNEDDAAFNKRGLLLPITEIAGAKKIWDAALAHARKQ